MAIKGFEVEATIEKKATGVDISIVLVGPEDQQKIEEAIQTLLANLRESGCLYIAPYIHHRGNFIEVHLR
jgi:sirohydrochlorin ferrochelatase